jgi:isopentenyl phosphate kinase
MSGNIVILKIGGSSCTNKAKEETLDHQALEWFAKLIASSVDESLLASGATVNQSAGPKPKFIVIHGAGSFGHHSAKRYGMRCGKSIFEEGACTSNGLSAPSKNDLQYQMEGLSKTRHSVQKLNAAIVGVLLNHGVNAVGISPGMSISTIRAHGATTCNGKTDSSYEGMKLLCQSLHQSLEAGLVPVLHGDACLLYDDKRAGILGGDTLVEGVANLWNESTRQRHAIDDIKQSTISKVIFITDVAGVFTADPKSDEDAVLIKHLKVDCSNGEVIVADDNGSERNLEVGGSSHAHDVTGGLKVRNCTVLKT